MEDRSKSLQGHLDRVMALTEEKAAAEGERYSLLQKLGRDPNLKFDEIANSSNDLNTCSPLHIHFVISTRLASERRAQEAEARATRLVQERDSKARHADFLQVELDSKSEALMQAHREYTGKGYNLVNSYFTTMDLKIRETYVGFDV